MKLTEFFQESSRLGTFLFIFTETVFFIFLITAYIYYHVDVGAGGATANSSLNPVRTGIFTIILLSSSATVYMAERAFRKKKRSFRAWLALTIACGIAFLYGELTEYVEMLHHDVSISRNVFGSTFFTLTGFHAAHVTFGLIMLTTLLLLSFNNKLRERHGIAVENISWYWHFVDLVWAAVFSTVYLWSTR